MIDSPLFVPSAATIAESRVQQMINDLSLRGVTPAHVIDAHSLQRWSVEHPEIFWREMWKAADIIAEGPGSDKEPWEHVLVGGHRMAPPDPVEGPHWFTGTRLNFAEHMLRHRGDHTALVSWNERGAKTRMTYDELRANVARCAAALQDCGVVSGDRVAGWMPNIPETIVAMLAAASIGAIWSSCSPDFGTRGVLDRFGQIEPKVIIAADGYIYAGKEIDCLERLRQIAESIPSLKAVWVVPYLRSDPQLSQVPNAIRFDNLLGKYSTATEPQFARLPFDHPLYIMYSSGTTGLPKCMVHGAGGTLLQHWKEHALHTNLTERDVLFYFTTCGWMMWNWLVSALGIGATLVLYDGAPLAPDPTILWKMAEAERVSVFGTSAKYLAVLEKEGVVPRSLFNLQSLRTILSTGSPLAEHSYDFVYRDISPSVCLASISGGTDIISCFALGDPTGAVWRGELQIRGLGMAVEVWNEAGESVEQEAGELVCTKPFPSMPIAFWNDSDGALYKAAYFDHFPGVWRHGDWAEVTAHDGLVIHGRSDATLNPGGVRIGTAEIYRQVEQIAAVLESVVVEQRYVGPDGPDSRVVLFVKLRENETLTEELRATIRKRIREYTSPHHVPKVIIAVPDIPRTISGKITEMAVREVIHHRPVKNLDALANPESLRYFSHLSELETS